MKPWLKRTLIALAAVVVLLIAAYFLLTSSLFIRGVVLPRVSSAMGVPLTAEKIRLSPFSRVRVSGLRAGTAEQPLAAVDELDVQYRLLPMLKRRVVVESVRVTGAELTLVRDADGRLLLPGVAADAEPGAPPPPEPTGSGGRPLPEFELDLGPVDITGLSLRYTQLGPDSSTPVQEITVEDVNFRLQGLRTGSTGTASWQAGARVLLPDLELTDGRIEGELEIGLGADSLPQALDARVTVNVPRLRSAERELTGLLLQIGAGLERGGSLLEWQTGLTISLAEHKAEVGTATLSGRIDAAGPGADLRITAGPFEAATLTALSGTTTPLTAGTLGYEGEFVLEAGALLRTQGRFTADALQATTGTGTAAPVLDLALEHQLTVDMDTWEIRVDSLQSQVREHGGRELLELRLSEPLELRLVEGDPIPQVTRGATLTLLAEDLDLPTLTALVPTDALTVTRGRLSSDCQFVLPVGDAPITAEGTVTVTDLDVTAPPLQATGLHADKHFRLQATADRHLALETFSLRLQQDDLPVADLALNGELALPLDSAPVRLEFSSEHIDLTRMLSWLETEPADGTETVTPSAPTTPAEPDPSSAPSPLKQLVGVTVEGRGRIGRIDTPWARVDDLVTSLDLDADGNLNARVRTGLRDVQAGASVTNLGLRFEAAVAGGITPEGSVRGLTATATGTVDTGVVAEVPVTGRGLELTLEATPEDAGAWRITTAGVDLLDQGTVQARFGATGTVAPSPLTADLELDAAVLDERLLSPFTPLLQGVEVQMPGTEYTARVQLAADGSLSADGRLTAPVIRAGVPPAEYTELSLALRHGLTVAPETQTAVLRELDLSLSDGHDGRLALQTAGEVRVVWAETEGAGQALPDARLDLRAEAFDLAALAPLAQALGGVDELRGSFTARTDVQITEGLTSLTTREPLQLSGLTLHATPVAIDNITVEQTGELAMTAADRAEVRDLALRITQAEEAVMDLQLSGDVSIPPLGRKSDLKAHLTRLDAGAIKGWLADSTAAEPGPATEPPTEPTEPTGDSPNPWPDMQGTEVRVEVTADEILYEGTRLQNLQAVLTVLDAAVAVDPLTFALNGAPMAAALNLSLTQAAPDWNARLEATGMQFQPLATAFTPAFAPSVSGGLEQLLVSVEGNGLAVADILRSLNGSVAARFTPFTVPTAIDQAVTKLPGANLIVLPARILAQITSVVPAQSLPRDLARYSAEAREAFDDAKQLSFSEGQLNIGVENGAVRITDSFLRGKLVDESSFSGTISLDRAVGAAGDAPQITSAPLDLNLGLKIRQISFDVPVGGTLGQPKPNLSGVARSLITNVGISVLQDAIKARQEGEDVDAGDLLRNLLRSDDEPEAGEAPAENDEAVEPAPVTTEGDTAAEPPAEPAEVKSEDAAVDLLNQVLDGRRDEGEEESAEDKLIKDVGGALIRGLLKDR